MSTNLNDTEWERECRFSVRSVVHTVTAILVEFESNHMGFEVFKVLSTKGYICDSKEMQVMLGCCCCGLTWRGCTCMYCHCCCCW